MVLSNFGWAYFFFQFDFARPPAVVDMASLAEGSISASKLAFEKGGSTDRRSSNDNNSKYRQSVVT